MTVRLVNDCSGRPSETDTILLLVWKSAMAGVRDHFDTRITSMSASTLDEGSHSRPTPDIQLVDLRARQRSFIS